MLIEFAATNFRSIKERQVLSMLPSERVKLEKRKNALFNVPGYKNLDLLTLAGIWGRNSSGKSNLIKAFKAMKWLVLKSHTFTYGDSLKANESFAFDVKYHDMPTLFEMDFVGEDRKRYFYLIEFDEKEIYKEELHYYVISDQEKTTRRKLYVRHKGDTITYGEDFRGFRKVVEERTLPNVLFLSKSVQENNAFLNPVFDFFKMGFAVSDFTEHQIDFQSRYFAKIAGEDNQKDLEILNNALKSIDTGILQLEIEKTNKLPKNIIIEPEDELNEKQIKEREMFIDIFKTEIKAVHRVFEGNNEIGIERRALQEESEGTRKFIAVFSAFMQIIKKGNLFVVDEFDKSFHPLLTKTLILLLANPRINKNGAQLIFTTHDADLMDVLDNDQINLLQKDEYGATEIYAVSDIRGLRGDVSIAKRYLRGELEAIPTINHSAINRSLEVYYHGN